MTIEDQVVIADADIVIGVPCYKDGPMVARALDSFAEAGVQLLIVDNGSNPDVKTPLEGRGVVIRNEVNRYVNPAWNQMMQLFQVRWRQCDLLVLANSDLVLDAGWADTIRKHRHASTAEQLIFGIDRQRQRCSNGTFFALTQRAITACCPIPDDLLVFGGDDFIFNVVPGVGCEVHVVHGLTMTHVERGTYDKSPEVWKIARRDTDRWIAHGRDLVEKRIFEIAGSDRVSFFWEAVGRNTDGWAACARVDCHDGEDLRARFQTRRHSRSR